MPIIEYENCTAMPEVQGHLGDRRLRLSRQPSDWDGKYIFGDWSKSFAEPDGQLFVATKGRATASGPWRTSKSPTWTVLAYVLAFGQDNDGEVYVLTSVTTGPVGGLDTIYKIVPAQ